MTPHLPARMRGKFPAASHTADSLSPYRDQYCRVLPELFSRLRDRLGFVGSLDIAKSYGSFDGGVDVPNRCGMWFRLAVGHSGVHGGRRVQNNGNGKCHANEQCEIFAALITGPPWGRFPVDIPRLSWLRDSH
jgi:hypothetical protein